MWRRYKTPLSCQTARQCIIFPWWCDRRIRILRVPRDHLGHLASTGPRPRTLDHESPVNSCGHVVEACRVVSPASSASPSHLWPCDLHELWRTPLRPTLGHSLGRYEISYVACDRQNRDRKPRMGRGGYTSWSTGGLAAAGSTCSPRLAPIELVLLGSRLLDQPIPRSRCSLAGSLPLHEESAGHDDTHRPSARAHSRPREREKLAPPQVGGKAE